MNPRNLPTNAPRRRRWLLVDDNQDILSLMQETLTQLFGAEVDAFQSPRNALAAFQAAPEEYQCVITDLEMPLMNGFELCERLRALDPEARVFLATGSHFVTAEEARARGFCGLLTKPFSHSTLQREITSAHCLTCQINALDQPESRAWKN